jgi:hypothetical protein
MELARPRGDREAVENFHLQAGQFCSFIEGCTHLDRSTLIQKLTILMARICDAGSRLPQVDPATTDGEESTAQSAERHAKRCVALATSLGKQLGKLDEYWDVFDPTEERTAIHCLLSMDLAEVYMDLKDAVALERSGLAAEDAYWQWRFDFLSHWSRHAASALRVLLILSNRV